MANLLCKDGIHAEAKSCGIVYYSHANIEYAYKPLTDRLTYTTNVEGLDS